METLGRYRLIRKIGAGGMAEVFLAVARGAQGTDKTLVIKKVHPALAEDDRFIEMFVEEARLAVRLNHSNVVQVYAFERVEGDYLLAMEHMDGPDLHVLLASARRAGLPMPRGLAAYVAAEVAKGLDYAHSRRDDRGVPLDIVHRDVSPHNVLTSRDGAVKIADFGVARARRLHDPGSDGLRGKIAYMSPEQAEGLPVDARSDVFSLGMVLHEMLVGRPAVEQRPGRDLLPVMRAARHPSPREIDHSVPSELDAIVRRAIARDPYERFQTAREMAQSLVRYLHSLEEIHDSQLLEEWINGLVPDDAEQGPVVYEDREETTVREVPIQSEDEGTTAPLRRLGEEERRPVVLVAARFEIEPHPDRAAVSAEIERLVDDMAYKADGLLREAPPGAHVFLGVPHSSIEDAIRGIRLAHDFVDAAGALSRDNRIEIRARAAVVRGDARCRAGSARNEPLFEVDPALEEHARALLALAGGDDIVVGGGAYRLSRQDFRFEELPVASGGLHAYRVSGSKSRLERTRERSRAGAFRGREVEIAQLADAYGRARRGRTVIVRVSGDVGVGKSRLVGEFLDIEGRDAARTIGVECLLSDRDTPLAAASAAIRATLGIAEGEDRGPLIDRIRALLPGAPAYSARQERLFADLFAAPERAWSRRGARQRDLVRRVAGGLAVLLSLAAREGPVIVVVENAHLLDVQSIDALSELARVRGRVPVLALLVGLSGIAAGRHISGLEDLEVAELSDSVLAEIVRERLGADDDPSGLVDRIVSRAQGNPFFAEEIVESLVERGLVEPSANRGGPGQIEPDEIPLPTTMEGLAAGRIDALDARLRSVLRAAAALGSGFGAAAVGDLLGRDVSSDLEELASLGFLVAEPGGSRGPPEYDFKKQMVREVAYAGLGEGNRRRIHSILAQDLLRAADRGIAAPAARVAWHLERCGEADRAARFYLEAGDEALLTSSIREGLKLYGRAVPLSPPGSSLRFEALSKREKVLRSLARHAERAADVAAMRTLAEGRGDSGEMALAGLRSAQMAYDRGDFEAAARDVAEALENGSRARDHFVQVEALRLLAYVAVEEGHLIGALDCCERALSLVPEGTDGAYLEARALGIKGFVLLSMGHLETAPQPLAESLVLFRRLGRRRNESLAMSNLALLAQARGELGEALDLLERAMLVDRRIREVSARGRKLAAAGSIRAEIGDFDGSFESLEEARRICRDNGEPAGEVEAELGLADLWLQKDEPVRAAEILDAVQRRGFASRSRLLLARHLQLAAQALLGNGRAEEALRAAEEAGRIALAAGMNGEVIHALARRALVLAETGLPGEAVAAAHRATDMLSDLGGVRRAEEIWWLKARVLSSAGQRYGAERALGRAADEVARKSGMLREGRLRVLYGSHPLVRDIARGLP